MLLTRQEAADRLRVSVRTLDRWRRYGLIDYQRVGPRSIRLAEQDVESLIVTRRDVRATQARRRLGLLRFRRAPG
jgi:excisionase family DNA binding protein